MKVNKFRIQKKQALGFFMMLNRKRYVMTQGHGYADGRS
jgi:hypothetical protein